MHHKAVFGIKVNEEVDGFEEDGILSIILLDVLGHFRRCLHDLLERVSDDVADMCVVCVKDVSEV